MEMKDYIFDVLRLDRGLVLLTNFFKNLSPRVDFANVFARQIQDFSFIVNCLVGMKMSLEQPKQ